MFILGIAVFLIGIFFMILSEFSYGPGMAMQAYNDLTITVFFIIVIAAVIIATGSFKTFIAAINALLSKKYIISAADKEKAIQLFKLIGKTVVYASVLAAVTGLISLLYNMSDIASIGPTIAAALIAIFQGACINLIFIYPAINVLQTRYNTEEKRVISEKQVIDKLLELCYKQGITPEEILDAHEISFRK